MLGVVAGIVAAVLALGVAELVAGVRQEWRSPVIDVGDRVIDNVPSFVKDFAIETFGTNDKPALLIGIGATLLIYAAILGALSFRYRIEVGLVGIGVFGLIGAWSAVSNRAGGSLVDAIPAVIGSVVGAGALWFIHRVAWPLFAGSPIADAASPSDPTDASRPSPTDAPRATRRELLVRSGGVLAALAFVGTGAGAIGRTIRSRFSATESRRTSRSRRPRTRSLRSRTASRSVSTGLPRSSRRTPTSTGSTRRSPCPRCRPRATSSG